MTPKRAVLKLSAASTIVLTAVAVSAAGPPCSIHPKKGIPSRDVPSLARVTRAQAEHAARSSIKAPPAAIVREGDLEIERGCLVYSFDIRLPGRSGVDEVVVDAGTGRTLSHTHETARQETAEHARDGAVPSK